MDKVEWIVALKRGDFITALGADKAERLATLIESRGVPAGGFIMNLPLDDGGYAAFVFKIMKPNGLLQRISHVGQIGFGMVASIIADKPGGIPELPEEVRHYPQWWID